MGLLVGIFFVGCEKSEEDKRIESEIFGERQELFFKCLANIPKGPERTVTNDWAEVVHECEISAYNLSKKRY